MRITLVGRPCALAAIQAAASSPSNEGLAEQPHDQLVGIGHEDNCHR
jgi:hypothetical protein